MNGSHHIRSLGARTEYAPTAHMNLIDSHSGSVEAMFRTDYSEVLTSEFTIPNDQFY